MWRAISRLIVLDVRGYVTPLRGAEGPDWSAT